jgi:predicted DNA-binding WGR domain protein
MVYLELSDDKSHKFYEVTVQSTEVMIRYGRIGTEGQISSSTYDTVQKAQVAAEKKINEKLKKGYVRSSQPSKSALNQPAETNRHPDDLLYWLPEEFHVDADSSGSVASQAIGGRGAGGHIFPTVNQYMGADGGYVAFYSRDPAKAVYSIGGGIYVVGRIRLKGRYIGRIFHPAGYEHQDISAAPEFKELCRNTFGVEGWAGGDTGGWFGKPLLPSSGRSGVKHRQSGDGGIHSLELIDRSTRSIMAVTLQAGEEVRWQTSQLRSRCVMQIAAISHSPWFSFNLTVRDDIAYHFNPRTSQGQIVQNTRVAQQWGEEERIPLPPVIMSGEEFELAIAIQAAEFAVYLNGNWLCDYQHRLSAAAIDGLFLVSTQGSLEVVSVKVSK